jgi:hypothetical protein
LRKKKKAGGFTLSNFKKYYKVTIITAECYGHKDRHKTNEAEQKAQK